MKTVRIGSRDSTLAVAQARLVMDAVHRLRPKLRLELVTMKTSGDRLLDQPLDALGGKGLFIKELDDALAGGRVDACVHSYKDMPVPDNPHLPVAAVCRRDDPRDVLVLPAGAGGDAPDPALPVGTSSLRRRHQLAALYPHLRTEPVRGNVHTRLAKLDDGRYGALVLAAAGLKRLGLLDRASRAFAPDEMLPAACQGMLAVQVRAGDDHAWLAGLDDPDSRRAAEAERAFVHGLDATCASPVAAYAQVANGKLRLSGWRIGDDGQPRSGCIDGDASHAARVGAELAVRLKGSHS